LRRKCACGGQAGFQGECEECKEKKEKKESSVQRRADGAGGPAIAPPIVHAVLRSPGRPLDAATRASMESRLGHDFGNVRVHSGAQAAESARAVDALAYTVGSDVVFAEGRYAPHDTAGRRLLTHELTHVVQQRGARCSNSAPLPIGQPSDTAELEAERIAEGVGHLAGESSPAGSTASLRRQHLTKNQPLVTRGSSFATNPGDRSWVVLEDNRPVSGQMGRNAMAIRPKTTPDDYDDWKTGNFTGIVSIKDDEAGVDIQLNSIFDYNGTPKDGRGGRFVGPTFLTAAINNIDWGTHVNIRVVKADAFWDWDLHEAELHLDVQVEIKSAKVNRTYHRNPIYYGSGASGSGTAIQEGKSSANAAPESSEAAPTAVAANNPAGPQGAPKKEASVQLKAAGASSPAIAPPVVHQVLRSPGRPLDPSTRASMKSHLGFDFGHVRVHADAQAAESVRAVDALAYTVGSDVVFGTGRYAPQNAAGQRLLAHELTHVVQQRGAGNAGAQQELAVGPADDSLEREAERSAVGAVSAPGRSPVRVQRAVAAQAPAEPASKAPAQPVAASLIAEDEVRDLGPGQMHKSEFLNALRTAVCATADAALAAVGRTAQGCPFIERWIDHLRTRNSRHVERAIRKYAPEAAKVGSAREYIPLVASRVQRGVTRWAATGKVADVPEELAGELPGAGLTGAVGGAIAGASSAITGAASAVAGGLGKAVSGIGGLLMKAREGGARPTRDPGAVQSQLNSGASLDGGMRSRMEGAFGYDFSQVRVHTDARAAQLSSNLNARAFTIGNDVAFGAGEYRPGTPIGDALLAHELAHVVQQGAATAPTPSNSTGTEYHNLEDDADLAAAGAVVSLWTGTKGAMRRIGRQAMPRLKSGLRLQRCGGAQATPQTPNLKTDKVLKQNWDAALKDGLALLNQSISGKNQKPGCAFPAGKKPEQWNYGPGWRREPYGEEVGKYHVAFIPTKLPHESVDLLFDNLDQWECDCALFTELAWLYAWRHALSIDEFDKKFSNLRLRPQQSAGLERETHIADNMGEGGLEPGNFDEMWRNAAVGTKVAWSNNSLAAKDKGWEDENAIKSFKGTSEELDRYDAHPLGAGLSEAQVKLGLARHAHDFPDTYVITSDTLARLRAFGAPEPFVQNLGSLLNQRFVGLQAFVDAQKQPALALHQLFVQDPDRYSDVRNKTIELSQKIPATEEATQAYIKANIVRRELSIPK